MARRVRTPADIGTLVRSARKEQHLRQDELAGVAGVGLRFIVDLEAGKPTAQIAVAYVTEVRPMERQVDILGKSTDGAERLGK